eukprot:CAMPEP_0119272088 /NCGR_PEP_ID=MMETSP1329-20130426/8412_1 /TAXON_ID=114041 /ORGANISM="Genus nov. species nov., Strain RCC1024" /LENGTH=46 /DNA_ID= /DNA_START= /DNA_END= /DNA_ORIENTATION=
MCLYLVLNQQVASLPTVIHRQNHLQNTPAGGYTARAPRGAPACVSA